MSGHPLDRFSEELKTFGARRVADSDRFYWSVTHFMMPFYNAFNSGSGDDARPSVGGFAWVPMDDTTTMAWCFTWNPQRPLRDDEHWLRHSLAYREADGTVRLEYKDVQMGPYIPMERKY